MSKSQPQPAGNWINPFQFAAYKDKVDLKKRQMGAAWDTQAQVGIPPSHHYKSNTVYKTHIQTHKLHTCKLSNGGMRPVRYHPSLSLIDMFDFLCGCDSWVFGFIRHLWEFPSAACLWLMRTMGTRSPSAVHNNKPSPYISLIQHVQLSLQFKDAELSSEGKHTWFCAHARVHTQISRPKHDHLTGIFGTWERQSVCGVVPLYTWLAAWLTTSQLLG